MRELVLLTAEFPYGNVTEPFLETEIEVLSERFDRILVLPSHQQPRVRELPGNAELVRMDWLSEPSAGSRRAAILSRRSLQVARSTIAGASSLAPYARAPRMYADNLARNLLKLRSLRKFVSERSLQRAVFYDYWFENSTLALALLRRDGAIRAAVCRAHNFDVYDDRWASGAVPFRAAKAEWLDAIYVVSDSGRRYLAERVPRMREKLELHRLGVRDPGRVGPERCEDGVPLIVTCGRLVASKRIHLVPSVLKALARPVRWIHLGDGPELDRITSEASRLGVDVSWEIRGQLDNRDVLAFYASQHVDALLSVSTSEGLPVSMMEAQSYGIPIVARAVGGVAEIVSERTGVLLPGAAGVGEIAAGLASALEPGRFEPGVIREHFHDQFDSDVNYGEFADALVARLPD